MPSIINSDNGVSSGTSGLKTTGGNDGITTFQQNGTEAMRIDSSGNVGIGTSSPASKLNVYDASDAIVQIDGNSNVLSRTTRYSSDVNASQLALRKTRGTFAAPTAVNSGDFTGSISFQAYGGTNYRGAASIIGAVDTYTSDTNISGYLAFTTNGGSTATTERMRIDSTGRVGIGTNSPTALLNLAAGTATANTGPLKFTSGTNLGTPEAGAVEYDGTIMTATSNTNFGRGAIPLLIYTTGTGTALTTNGEATLQALLPAANDTITLSIGTYFLDMYYIVTRGPTSTTSATARLNILGTGGAAGNFSGIAVSSPTNGGTISSFSFDAVNINVSNVVTAASASAAGVYVITLRGLLKITTGGTIRPQYNLSANINAAGTVSKVFTFNLTQMDSQSAAASGPAGAGWA